MPPKKSAKIAYKKRNKKTKASKKGGLVTKAQLYRAINRNVETKQVNMTLGLTNFNSGISSAAEFYTVLPAISQGVNSNQRLGDQIRPKRIVIRGYVQFLSDAWVGATMLLARQFCFQPKNIRYQPQTTTAAGTTLLTDGAVPAAYTGTLLDQTKTHNNEEFTFFMDKRRTFLKPYGYTNQSIPSVNTKDDL